MMSQVLQVQTNQFKERSAYSVPILIWKDIERKAVGTKSGTNNLFKIVYR